MQPLCHPRCACGCVPAVPSLFEMAALRAERRRIKDQRRRHEDTQQEHGCDSQPLDLTCQRPGQGTEPFVEEALSPVSDGKFAGVCDSTEEARTTYRELLAEKRKLQREVQFQRDFRAALLSLHQPTAREKERRVELTLSDRKIEVVIAQDANLAQGGLLWDSGIILANYLVNHGDALLQAARAVPKKRLRVLELGCGAAAVPSMAAALTFQADVVATDSLEVVRMAATNIKRNQPVLGERAIRSISVETLDWKASEEYSWPEFDVVLGADLLYDRSMHQPLCDAIWKNLSKTGLLLLAFPVRDAVAEDNFFDLLSQRGFRARIEIDAESLVTGTILKPANGFRLVQVSANGLIQETPLEGSAAIDPAFENGLHL